MIEIFKTQNEYDIYTSYNTCLQSDRLYYIKENGKTHFYTNNIDGEAKIYNNGAVPQGTKSITANGTNIDVTSYESVDVNVPIPPGYIIPSGNISITTNGTVDVTSYENAVVNVLDLSFQKLIDKSIEEAYIPEGTTQIGNSVFIYCSYLSYVSIPNTVTSIGNYAFGDCSNLQEITIPNSVTYIGNNAFQFTSLLEITIPDSVTTLGNSVLSGISNLNKVTIGSGLEMSTSFTYNMFTNNTGNQTTVAYYNSPILYKNFFKYGRLPFLYLGANVSSIYSGINSSLTYLTCYPTTPPTITLDSGQTASQFFPNGLQKIYVPAESVDLYKSASIWNQYPTKIEAIP